MSFFQGLITGAAKSIDAQLKKDMERTQERAEGMAQYRVTRRRAKLEEQEKERKEIGEVLSTLAAYTDGDEDKAIQLYNSAGKTVAGGQRLAETLRTNREAGKDIGAVIKYAEAGAAPGNFTDFIERNITPITPITGTADQMKAAGLYGALFKPDFTSAIQQRVDEEAPITRKVPEGEARVAQATIDYTGLLSAEEAKFEKAKREQTLAAFDLQKDKFALLSEETKASMEIARRAQELAETAQKQKVSQDVVDNLNEAARIRMEEARLEIAKDEARERARTGLGERQLQGLELQLGRLKLEKLQEAPQYATHEAMLIAADNELVTLQTKKPEDLTETEAARIIELEDMRKVALKGIKDATAAESTASFKPSYSTQSIDSIINNEMKRELGTVGLYDNLNDKIEQMTDGNAAAHLTANHRALANAANRNTTNDAGMTAAIATARESLNQRVQEQASKIYEKYAIAKSKDGFDPTKFKVTEGSVLADYVERAMAQDTDLSAADATRKFAVENGLEKGHIVNVGDNFIMWTGATFIGV